MAKLSFRKEDDQEENSFAKEFSSCNLLSENSYMAAAKSTRFLYRRDETRVAVDETLASGHLVRTALKRY